MTYPFADRVAEDQRLVAQGQVFDPLTRRLLERAGLVAGMRVLDLGCGDGTLLRYLADERESIGYGVEIDDDGILACVNNGVNVIQGDLERGLSGFADGSFDYVIAINYNRQPGTSPLDWTRPLGASRGGGIWIHVDHGGPTHGCVSIAEAHMKELLRTLDPARHPVVVIGDAAALDSSYVRAHRSAHGGKGGRGHRPSGARAAARRPRSTRSPMSSAAPDDEVCDVAFPVSD